MSSAGLRHHRLEELRQDDADRKTGRRVHAPRAAGRRPSSTRIMTSTSTSEGADSYRHRLAGAAEVAIVSGRRWALMHELRGEDEPKLDAILARLCAVRPRAGRGLQARDASQDRDPTAGRQGHRRRCRPAIRTSVAIAADHAVEARPAGLSDRRCRRDRRLHRRETGLPGRRTLTEDQRLLRIWLVLQVDFFAEKWEYRARGWSGAPSRRPRGRQRIHDFAENLNREEYHAYLTRIALAVSAAALALSLGAARPRTRC